MQHRVLTDIKEVMESDFPSNWATADQATVTMGNSDGDIGGLTIGATYAQAEIQALRDNTETLADDARNLHTLLISLRLALIDAGVIKGAA